MLKVIHVLGHFSLPFPQDVTDWTVCRVSTCVRQLFKTCSRHISGLILDKSIYLFKYRR